MSNYGTMLLSKVIDDNDVQALAKFNVESTQFKVDTDKRAFEFIRTYAEQNGGQAPSYATVLENVPGFFYIAEVSDSYDYLTRRLRNDAGLVDFATLLQSDLQALVDEYKNDVPTMIDKVSEKLDTIKKRTDVREKIGTDVKTDKDRFLEEFERRKEGKSFKTWKSKFSPIGDYVSGNMYVFYAKSGRGKSVIASVEEGLEMAMQGANVLVWSMEMPWYEVFVRLYVSLSGRKGWTTANVGGIDMNAGFDANSVRSGQMPPEFETAFKAFLSDINNEIPGNITVRGVDDPDFSDRSLRRLEADIIQTEADVVIVDPFYYVDYEKNTSKTAGGDAAETSKRLRRLTGTLSVVTLAITQADEGKEERDDEGTRELKLPEREAVKKTKALLEDAAMLIAIDTDYKQGRGLIGINKGRNGGEGDSKEIIYAPQYGVVREMETGAAIADQFGF